MNDRELLELAAKAAGIEIEPCSCSDARFPFKHKGDHGGHWSPLHDDGDALRLAVKLELVIEYRREASAAFVYNYASSLEIGQNNHNLDPYAATRRAIVRAAAEIGKAKGGAA